MSEKVSTITLRLTAEEAAQLEILKDIIGKKSGSEAIKYVVKEYPLSCRQSWLVEGLAPVAAGSSLPPVGMLPHTSGSVFRISR